MKSIFIVLKNKQQGYTLLELIVSMVISSIIIIGIYDAYSRISKLFILNVKKGTALSANLSFHSMLLFDISKCQYVMIDGINKISCCTSLDTINYQFGLDKVERMNNNTKTKIIYNDSVVSSFFFEGVKINYNQKGNLIDSITIRTKENELYIANKIYAYNELLFMYNLKEKIYFP